MQKSFCECGTSGERYAERVSCLLAGPDARISHNESAKSVELRIALSLSVQTPESSEPLEGFKDHWRYTSDKSCPILNNDRQIYEGVDSL